jgi:hypothetical protein
MSMLGAGTIYGVEFFFGYFGDPQVWGGWTTQKNACASSRLSECYANTDALQSISLQVIQAEVAAQQGKTAPAVSLSHTSLYLGTEYVGKKSTPGTVVMKNTGSGPLSISSIVVAGLNGNNFPISNNCGTSLAAGSVVR